MTTAAYQMLDARRRARDNARRTIERERDASEARRKWDAAVGQLSALIASGDLPPSFVGSMTNQLERTFGAALRVAETVRERRAA